jgi:hypothetical protein
MPIGIYPIVSTGHFRRMHGQSPRVLTTASTTDA